MKGKKTAKAERPDTVIAAVPPKKKTGGKAIEKPPATIESVDEAGPAAIKKGEAKRSSIKSDGDAQGKDGDAQGKVEDARSTASTEKKAPAKMNSARELMEKPVEKPAKRSAKQSEKKRAESDDSK